MNAEELKKAVLEEIGLRISELNKAAREYDDGGDALRGKLEAFAAVQLNALRAWIIGNL